MSELVSIIIPAYNAEKWIDQSIESALNQTWTSKEIIVVDDGSTDNTLLQARRFESKRVKVLSQDNRGASAARNKALSIAQGEYIQWLDADDILAFDKISQQLKFKEYCSGGRILLSSSFGGFYYRQWKAKFKPHALWQDLSPIEWMFHKFDKNLSLTIESWLVSRKLTEIAGPWDESLSMDDDGEYFCRVVSASEHVKFIIDAKSFFRQGAYNSLSSNISLSDKKKKSQLSSVCLQFKYLRSLQDSDRVRLACLKELQRLLIYYYPDNCNELYQMAQDLGGKLTTPELDWKYTLIEKSLGWEMVKKARHMIPKVKTIALQNIDRLLFNISNQ